MKTKKAKKKDFYFESKMNFDLKEFARYVNDELKYYGISLEKLAKDCYISHGRLESILIRQNVEIKDHEIKAIKKRLNID